jgi:hypothetical protein
MIKFNPDSIPRDSPLRTRLPDSSPSKEEITEFIGAWKADFNEEITPEYARIRLNELVQLYLLIMRPNLLKEALENED